MLPSADETYLAEKGLAHELHTEGGSLLLLIHDYELPTGYVPETTDLLIQIPTGYPGTKLDMFYVHPHIRLASGSPLNAADATWDVLGKTWQRFSRHLDKWRPGVDGIASFLAIVRADLTRSAQ